MAGSRFAYLKGDLVLLELALVRWTLELLGERGFEPVSRPCSCARRRCSAPASCPTPSSRSTGSPTTRSTSRARARSRWRRCTPARCSPRPTCRSATRASRPASGARPARPGRDTRGIFRVHQFDKVEMFSFVRPEDAEAEHERLLEIEEAILQALEIPYRVVNIARRRPRRLGGQEVRLRGLAARPAALPRADLDLEHDRLPVAPARHPLPAGRRRQAGPRAHAQRHRGRGRPHADRAAREPPARGRHGRRARRAAPVGCAARPCG